MRTMRMFLALSMVAACGGVHGPVLHPKDAALSGGSSGSGGSVVGSGGSVLGTGGTSTGGAAGSTGRGGSGVGGAGTGGKPGTGGVVANGGVTGRGGATGTGGATAIGGTTGTGGAIGTSACIDAGGNLSIPFEQAGQYACCGADDDCHILWTNCSCAAVNTQVDELVDPQICARNNCRSSSAVCASGQCALVLPSPG